MTPAEVIAMRDRLAEELWRAPIDDDYESIAVWLIETGWVVAPPKREGENDG